MAAGNELTVASASSQAPVSPAVEEVSPPPYEPALLDLPEGMVDGPVDLGWAPQARTDRSTPSSPLNWIAGGLAVLLLGWLVLAAAAFVQDQFDRSALNGAVTLAVFGAGLAAMLRGAWLELSSLRRLRCVDALRAALTQKDGPVAPTRRLALDWLDRLPHLSEAATARPAVAAAPDLPALRAALRLHLDVSLQHAARRAGDRAAAEGAAAVAISPSPAMDGILAALRGLALVRQVAALHGMRPGGTVTLALLRRVAWTAAGTSGIDLLGQGLAHGVLAHLPGVRQVAAAIPGAGLTALRLRHLARVTARACSPLDEG